MQEMFRQRAASMSKPENNGKGTQARQRCIAERGNAFTLNTVSHPGIDYFTLQSLGQIHNATPRRSLLFSRSTEKTQKCVGQVGHDVTAFPGRGHSRPEEVLLSKDFTAPEVRLQRSVYPPFWPYQIRLGASGRQTAQRQIKLNFPRKTAPAECVFLLPENVPQRAAQPSCSQNKHF